MTRKIGLLLIWHKDTGLGNGLGWYLNLSWTKLILYWRNTGACFLLAKRFATVSPHHNYAYLNRLTPASTQSKGILNGNGAPLANDKKSWTDIKILVWNKRSLRKMLRPAPALNLAQSYVSYQLKLDPSCMMWRKWRPALPVATRWRLMRRGRRCSMLALHTWLIHVQ